MTIQIVTESPYQQLTQTGNGGNIGTTAFREAGVTLNVSPKIANDGTLQLNVTPTFSRLAGFTTGSLPAPIIDKREASTTVRVVDGQTLVLGGLRQRADTRERRGVPYLKDAKHLGSLFRGRNDTVRESELVVFITPEIIMPADDRSKPREWAANARVRGELERIPVAPEMVWPNVYGNIDCGGPAHVVHPVPVPQPAVEMVIPAPANSTPVMPVEPTPPSPTEEPSASILPSGDEFHIPDTAATAPHENANQRQAFDLRRMPAGPAEHRTARRVRHAESTEQRERMIPVGPDDGLLRAFYR